MAQLTNLCKLLDFYQVPLSNTEEDVFLLVANLKSIV
jgi:hypothetical protein